MSMATWTSQRARALGILTMAAVPAVLLLPLAGGCSSASDSPVVGVSKSSVSKSSPVASAARHLARREAPVVQQGGPTPIHAGTSPEGGSPATGDKLQYLGGAVISNVQIYAIFWGSTVNAAIQTNIASFYQAVTNSPYWAWLAEYNTVGLGGTNQVIGPGTFVSAITITPVNQNTTITDGDIGAELQAQITSGVIPGPHETTNGFDSAGNVNVLYMIDFPGNITINYGGAPSCVSFCGFHEAATITDLNAVNYTIPFGVLLDTFDGPCSHGGCGSFAPLDNSYSVHSHELAEAVTDGFNTLAWFDYADQSSAVPNGREIADICAYNYGTIGGFTVQKLWSNVNDACIDVPPPCNGGSEPPPFCTPCTSSSQCSGLTPVCETTAGSPYVGQCVACSGSVVSGCAGGTPFCDTTTDTCRACTVSDCAAPTAICESSGAAAGTCVACDATNTSTCTGATPVCDLTVFVCVGCVTHADCKDASMPTCDVATQTCRACAANSDCPGDVCVTDSGSSKAGQCVGCLKDSDCGGSNGDCDTATNTCTCTKNEQCSNPTPTCSNSTCVACKTASDCAGNKGGPVCSSGSCREPAGSEPGSRDAGHDSGVVLTLPDAGASSSGSSSGGCTAARTGRPSDVLSFLLPLAFFGVRQSRRSRAR
jgi:hypothetical protein